MFISKKTVSRQIVFIGLILSSSTVLSEELMQRTQAAQQVTQQFVTQLGSQLKKEMETNGPVSAIKVCKDIAPGIANQLSIENGWRVSRVSNKVRNPLSGLPDQWESEVLTEFEALAEKGGEYSAMEKTAVVDENGVFYFRYMKPLSIKPVCLNCHGSEETMPAEVKAELEKQYPFDKAKNYKDGDLRGAVSIKQPMATPLKAKF